MAEPPRDRGEAPGAEVVSVPVELDEELAVQNVERLLERMDVPRDEAVGVQDTDRELGVDRALGRSDDHPPGKPAHARGGRPRRVAERPVDMTDMMDAHQRPSIERRPSTNHTACTGASPRLTSRCGVVESRAIASPGPSSRSSNPIWIDSRPWST